MRYASNTMNRRNKTSEKNRINNVQRNNIDKTDLYFYERPGTNASPDGLIIDSAPQVQGNQDRKVMNASK